LQNDASVPGIVVMMICIVAFSLSLSPAAAQEGALTIDTTQSMGEINPYVYGANYGPWALVPLATHEYAAQSGVTHFRFPAGNWGDQYDLTPQQIDMFVNQVRGWGGEASIHVRLEGGTPERAAELVRYANVEKGYNVRYWAIGNEPDLYDDYTVERFNAEWRDIAEAMLAVDPDIVLMGPDVSQFPYTRAGDPYTNVRREWVRSFLEANGDLVDIITVHRYPFPRQNADPATKIDDLRANTPQWDVLAQNLREVIVDTLGRELPMGITEVSSHWNIVRGGEGSPDSFYHAIWWADVLGRLIRERVSIVNYFTFASSTTDAYGLIGRSQPAPTYYVYALYGHLGDQLVASASDVDDVTITAAWDGDVLTFVVVNRGDEGLRLPLQIEGTTLTGEAEAWRLDAEHNAEPIGTLALSSGDLLDLPAQSASVYRVNADG
jgi:hypothetical protein